MMISLESNGDRLDAYVARPEGEARGGLVLIHEIWGLQDHMKRVADRYAREGYLVVAPDILSKPGVTPKAGAELFALGSSVDDAVRAEVQPRMRELFSVAADPVYGAWAVAALRSAADWLEQALPAGHKLATVGFCFGGSYAFQLAAADSRIAAAVPFYGYRPSVETLASITGPVLAIYGSEDAPLITGLPELSQDMADNGVDFDVAIYPDAGHAFFNEENKYQYRAEAATLSWQRSCEFLAQHTAKAEA